jgi:hypothetical protein
MSTLLSVPSQTYNPGTSVLGPFAMTSLRGRTVKVTLAATSWPASGDVVNVEFKFDDGNGGSSRLNGGVVPGPKGFPAFASGVPADANSVTLTVTVLQTFTSPIDVTST